MNEENVTGFEVRDFICTKWIDQRGKIIKGNMANEYKEIFITGRTGFLKHMDGVDVKRTCEMCGTPEIWGERSMEEINGLLVDVKEWDGSDMFYFKNWPGNLIVTERVKDIIEKGKFKNIQF